MVRYIAEAEDDALTINERPPLAYLVLLTNGRISHSFPLRDEVVELGRDKSNSVVVSDQKVSRRHASLTPIEETFILTDKGSANGTYLNGVLISQPIRLKELDRLTIGDTTFLFSADIPDADVLKQAVSAPVSLPPQPAVANSVLPNTALPDRTMWVLVGCLGLVIVGLVVALAVVLGLLIGRSQVVGVFMLLWQLVIF